MNKHILFIGVGGQGTILATKLFSLGIVSLGYDIKMSEIHGSSQRGGSVTTQIIYGDKVYTPLLGDGEADTIVSFEKSEALRALPFLKRGGQVIMDIREINPLAVQVGQAEYPHQADEELKKITGNVKIVKATEIAEQLGNVRSQNLVLLGALVKELKLDGVDWEKLVEQNVPEKSKDINIKAFKAGYAI
jgi:indolepyruvate ferredoxin oxidoreductase beta subunit